MPEHFCMICNKMLDEKQFYASHRTDKYPTGKIDRCKKCLTMHIDPWEPDSYMWILEELDVPYVKGEWDSLLEKYGQDPKRMTGTTIIGRYLSKMKLIQYKDLRFADTERLEEERQITKYKALKAQGLAETEIEEILQRDQKAEEPPRPQVVADETPVVQEPFVVDEYEDLLTDEERLQLKLKWGNDFMTQELIALEQLFVNYEASYDIQGAGMVDTLIMICKASFRANQLINCGDKLLMFP